MRIFIDDSLYIQLFQLGHAEELFSLTTSSKDSIRKWLEFPDQTTSVNDSLKFIEMVQKRHQDNNGFWAGIWKDQKLVGSIGLLFIDWKNKKTEIGYWLGQDFVGKGFVTKSCQALIDHIFNVLDLNRIEIRVKVGNKRSKSIPEKLGFQLDGVLRQSELFDGTYYDVEIYGLLAEDV